MEHNLYKELSNVPSLYNEFICEAQRLTLPSAVGHRYGL